MVQQIWFNEFPKKNLMTLSTFNLIVYAWIAVAIVIFPFVLKVTAPYGRHTSGGWGPLISNRWGWIIMEFPALFVFALLFLSGINHTRTVPLIIFGFWMIHYVNRVLIFPFRLHTKGKKMPVGIVISAIFFNIVNGFVNGYWLGHLALQYDISWLQDPRFIFGCIIFITGMVINMSSDNILLHLRKPGETGYVIPEKGLFTYISCPNHFGEIIEWCGFAVMSWCLPGLSFAIWTIINLLPRALQHHHWYKSKFSDYPPDRKAVIPFIL
jgi:3-oxo-5-alpha-steroid 4-dehydrogenase 1